MSKVKAGPIQADRLKSFVERIEKLIEERKALGGDIKDVFSEAKGVGYDVPTIRKVIALRAMDAADRDEMETLIDVYMHALGDAKRAAVEAMQKGAGTREAARAAGIAVGAASQLRTGVHGIENGEHVHEKQIGEQGDPRPQHVAHDPDGLILDTQGDREGGEVEVGIPTAGADAGNPVSGEMERSEGIEPVVVSLEDCSSAIELAPLGVGGSEEPACKAPTGGDLTTCDQLTPSESPSSSSGPPLHGDQPPLRESVGAVASLGERVANSIDDDLRIPDFLDRRQQVNA